MGQVQSNASYRLKSILDSDLYKFTMQQAVRQHFPNAEAVYRFTHRDKDVFFSRRCIDAFHSSLAGFQDVSLTSDEKAWLVATCPYFTTDYLDFLEQYRFKTEQVSVKFIPVSEDGQWGNVEIEARGLWLETILWEVPMMACLSELHFRIDKTDWSYSGQREMAQRKAEALLQADCTFSEFGTRRRRSYHTQDLVISSILKAAAKFPGVGKVTGTSNMFFAKKYDIPPVGTIAHEWFMGVAALTGYDDANIRALRLWEEIYSDMLLVALTDTFSTQVFFKEFSQDRRRVVKWQGLRQDSGDPLLFAPAAKAMYESVGVDYRKKSIIYSDAVTLEKALALKKQCADIGFPCSFGIGTFLTNDFHTKSSKYNDKSKALNMVIKLYSIDGQPCVKISDDLEKNTGDPGTVKFVKKKYGLPT
ncbi:Quinolinate phosphoribosyl transferase [Pisolithus marmoratus]|nr:Quinolinate phosphoribosyl transferase [Pisolithus marmoratus]